MLSNEIKERDGSERKTMTRILSTLDTRAMQSAHECDVTREQNVRVRVRSGVLPTPHPSQGSCHWKRNPEEKDN